MRLLWWMWAPVAVLLAYAVVLAVGVYTPEHPAIAVVASIAVSLLTWAGLSLWISRRMGWPVRASSALVAIPVVLLMVGSASYGGDLAIEERSTVTPAAVASVDVRPTGEDAFTVTYRFTDESGDPIPGDLDYRGDAGGYGLDVGDTTDLLVDPRGELPLALADETDSGQNRAMSVMGAGGLAVLYAVFGFVGARRRRRGWDDEHPLDL